MISSKVDFDLPDQRDKFIDQLVDHVNYHVWKDVGTGTNPVFQNSWTTATSKHFGYRYFPITNTVHVHGRLTPGTETDGTVIFTLPKKYSPIKEYSYAIVSDVAGGAGGRLVIMPTGAVTIYNANTTGTYYDINIIYPLD